mmetsp:Transcript_22396/g.64290  ORF Transcript_22396/g.64290 Transcript_22396/m.64290 type:complete len:126 (+) Transcript_22396:692-1069(+)
MGHLDDDYDEVFQGRDPKEVKPSSTPQKPAVDASSLSYGFSLPELPSPSYLTNMLFGSGFGGPTTPTKKAVPEIFVPKQQFFVMGKSMPPPHYARYPPVSDSITHSRMKKATKHFQICQFIPRLS